MLIPFIFKGESYMLDTDEMEIRKLSTESKTVEITIQVHDVNNEEDD